jgi:hypothetical protein
MLASPMKADASFRAWGFRRSSLIDFRRQRVGKNQRAPTKNDCIYDIVYRDSDISGLGNHCRLTASQK